MNVSQGGWEEESEEVEKSVILENEKWGKSKKKLMSQGGKSIGRVWAVKMREIHSIQLSST